MINSPAVVAHGIGGRQDLPLPYGFVIVGAIVALLVSFLAVGWFWSAPSDRRVPRSAPHWITRVLDSSVARWVVRLAGLVVTGYVLVAAVLGPDDARNPTAPTLYVLFWIGIPVLSAVVGPIWVLLSPLRTLHLLFCRAIGSDPAAGPFAWPRKLTYWPAAIGLGAFAWLELIAPERTSTTTILVFVAMYVGVQIVGVSLFGERWFRYAEPFEVLSRVLGALSPLGRLPDGQWVLRSPLRGLDSLRPRPGLVAVLIVMLGSTAYDGLSNSSLFNSWRNSSASSTLTFDTLAFATAVAAFALSYTAAAFLAGRAAGVRARDLPGVFASSLVPIALGYFVAHYFSLFVFESQTAVIRLSDPLSNGWNVLGLSGREVDYGVLSPTTIAVTQTLALIAGHIVGVFAAHGRAVALFSGRRAVLAQIPLFLVMIAYTWFGLLILFEA